MEHTEQEFSWQIDRFDDIKILRYQIPGFEQLPLEQKILIYYLAQASLAGRDILFDQNFRYNLDIRKTLETIYQHPKVDRSIQEFSELENYLKKVWFSSGIHHHYSNDKFTPGFSRDYLESVASIAGLDPQTTAPLFDIIFNGELHPSRLCQKEGCDLLKESANNYYSGVSQQEAEAFYGAMAERGDQSKPLSYGLNSRLEKQDGKLTEVMWKVGGEYSKAIEQIVYWLERAASVAIGTQREAIESLISFYRSGDLAEFDHFNTLWVGDTESKIDFVNGFIEVYGDALGYKASWEGIVNFKNEEATKRTEKMSNMAQWFEDHSPVDDKYKKPKVKGVSAKVITVAMLGGDCYPATPIGINLPNADWIRKEHGSKSVTIENITDAYAAASLGSGFGEEFYPDDATRELIKKHGTLAGNLHTDLHECLGHGSGQLAEGIKGDELKNYGSPLEEARADLFALYYLGDEKLLELGIMDSMDVMKAEYYNYIFNGIMGQLTRIEPGKDIVQAHMRCRQLVSSWVLERGSRDGILELTKIDGKHYITIFDYTSLRGLFAELLREVQRIKSEGDFAAGAMLMESYGVKVDQAIHKEVLERYAKLNQAPYSGFVNPMMRPVVDSEGHITDIEVTCSEGYTEQMLRYSSDYSFL